MFAAACEEELVGPQRNARPELAVPRLRQVTALDAPTAAERARFSSSHGVLLEFAAGRSITVPCKSSWTQALPDRLPQSERPRSETLNIG
jgi:hypothetical protein